jgi:L-2-hydroxyglutarate oxidase LhgO
MSTEQITIIGGGVIGCAIAYELSKLPRKEIFVLERNGEIKNNQSLRNSGVIHAGIYYPKNKEPLKAQFCVKGNRLLYDFCKEYEVPHKKTGKLVVATCEREEEYLDDILRTALDNDVPITKISGDEAKKMEPNVCVSSALYIPTSGIIEPSKLIATLEKLAKDNGVFFAPGNEVCGVNAKINLFEVISKCGNSMEKFETNILINAAGLYSDDIAKMINPESPYVMDPIRGESAKFYTIRKNIFVGMNVYPAPHGIDSTGKKMEVTLDEYKKLLDEKKVSRTVGVHLTPTFDITNNKQTVSIGPAPRGKVGKEDYGSELPLHPEKYYFERVKDFFPNLKSEDIELYQAGIRAKLKNYNDFVIERDPKYPGCINLIGIDSPGLTSSLAIAEYVRALVEQSN